jgi:hypothetical protein
VHAGGPGDGGVDLRLERPGRRAIVQCKWYGGYVGPAMVREVYGALVHEQADEAYLVTTGRLSAAARRWAAGKPLLLIDGEAFEETRRPLGRRLVRGAVRRLTRAVGTALAASAWVVTVALGTLLDAGKRTAKLAAFLPWRWRLVLGGAVAFYFLRSPVARALGL